MESKRLRDLYFKTYYQNQDIIDQEISEGIEKNRKGSCKIRLLDKYGRPMANQKLRVTQSSHDFKYGANIFLLDEFEDPSDNEKYRAMFKEYFNIATIPFYWDTLEPVEGSPRYAKDSAKVYRRPAPDLCLEYCRESGIDAKLHCLVYEGFVPKWLKTLPLDAVKEKYYERMRQISERYSGKLFEFEVLNEMLMCQNWDTRGRSPLTYERDAELWAFQTARKYFPNETLLINEGSPLYEIGKYTYRSRYFLHCENLLLKGATIDKIGIQHHLFANARENDTDYLSDSTYMVNRADPIMIKKGLDVLSSLGLPIEITEITVPTFGDSIEDEELQADILKLWYSIWFAHPSVDSAVYWNTVDGYSYVKPEWNENNCRGGLFHHDLTPKKSALMLKRLFSEIWHTDLEIETDGDGCVDFKGFFGKYSALINDKTYDLSIHKDHVNEFIITL